MKPKYYEILSDCVQKGISLGWHRAHKHDNNPDEDYILDHIENNIMNQICEYFTFDEF